MDNNLKTKTINKINDYLAGRISKKEASDWAIAVMKQKNFAVDEIVLEDAITALCGLHDDDDRWDTAQDDLIYLKNCLLGESPYVVTLEFSSKKSVIRLNSKGVNP
ncbi:hypothetical protein FJZ31_13490 [Candidatus Poribacteria bacterium]|nr:hypothetical protein [Candidatus Poribacteria bacterium]